MRLPENKVKELIALMNSVSNGGIPPQEPILELFDLAMDEKTVDFLLAVGSEPKTVQQLEEGYTAMGGEDWPTSATCTRSPLFSRAGWNFSPPVPGPPNGRRC